MSEKFKLGVNGAGGRMGQRIVALAHQDPLLVVAGARGAPAIAACRQGCRDSGNRGKIGVPIQAQVGERVDVVIDFSTPAGTVAIAQVCADRQIPLVVATTGLEGTNRESVLSAPGDHISRFAEHELAINSVRLVRRRTFAAGSEELMSR